MALVRDARCVARVQVTQGAPFTFDMTRCCTSSNVMDKWILAFTQTLIAFVHQEMKGLLRAS